MLYTVEYNLYIDLINTNTMRLHSKMKYLSVDMTSHKPDKNVIH